MIPTLQFGGEDVFLYEDWEDTPVGPYRALFHFTPQDFRTLFASTPEALDLVPTVHRFDRVFLASIKTKRDWGNLRIEVSSAEDRYEIELGYEETPLLKVINPVAARVPDFICRNEFYLRIAPRMLAPLLGTDPNQKIGGVTEMGRKTRFRIYRMWKVTRGRCFHNGVELGILGECHFQHDMGDFRPICNPVMSKLDLIVED